MAHVTSYDLVQQAVQAWPDLRNELPVGDLFGTCSENDFVHLTSTHKTAGTLLPVAYCNGRTLKEQFVLPVNVETDGRNGCPKCFDVSRLSFLKPEQMRTVEGRIMGWKRPVVWGFWRAWALLCVVGVAEKPWKDPVQKAVYRKTMSWELTKAGSGWSDVAFNLANPAGKEPEVAIQEAVELHVNFLQRKLAVNRTKQDYARSQAMSRLATELTTSNMNENEAAARGLELDGENGASFVKDVFCLLRDENVDEASDRTFVTNSAEAFLYSPNEALRSVSALSGRPVGGVLWGVQCNAATARVLQNHQPRGRWSHMALLPTLNPVEVDVFSTLWNGGTGSLPTDEAWETTANINLV